MPSAQQKTNTSSQRTPIIAPIVIISISLMVLASLFSLCTGMVGEFFNRTLSALFGATALLVPVTAVAIALFNLTGHKISKDQIVGLLFILLATIVTFQLGCKPTPRYPSGLGGIIGYLLGTGLMCLFGRFGSSLLVATFFVLGITLISENCFRTVAGNISKHTQIWRMTSLGRLGKPAKTEIESKSKPGAPVKITKLPPPETNADLCIKVDSTVEQNISSIPRPETRSPGSIQLPALSLLRRPIRSNDHRLEKNISENIRILEQTLANFGVDAKVLEVNCGPAITRYEVHPSAGTKVSRIVSLADDIALALAATGIRIEAPIPGKAAIGIEVPNKEIQPVYLREVIESTSFVKSSSSLTFALGKDIGGTPIIADLTKMPHLLIAGATGSGKSVCINALISSILFKSSPDQVKLLLIDPKMVELVSFNGIPHLLAPVVTDPKKAAGVLNWAVTEMENRYNLFAGAGVRDIERYNKIAGKTALPLILVVIDELADLMMISPADVEEAICRLAQMARAAGIHLVIATQRPSVDVITGLIKANIPSRLSFAVSSQIDSRTILDMNGAEKLLGKGDMLFLPIGSIKPHRIQGAYISDQEVESLVDFWQNQGKPEFQEEILSAEAISPKNTLDDDVDELFEQALELVVETGQASASYFQRRFRIGYTRAARIIDQLTDKGYVGALEGSKPRQVLISKERYQHLKESAEL